MTDLAHHTHFFTGFGVPAAAKDASIGPLARLWQRAFDAIYASRQRQAERELNRYFVRSGRVLTDDVERQMMEGLMRPGGWASRS